MKPLRHFLYGLIACASVLATSIVPVEESTLLDGELECEVVIAQPGKNEVCRSVKRPGVVKQSNWAISGLPQNVVTFTSVSLPSQKSPIFILNRSLLI